MLYCYCSNSKVGYIMNLLKDIIIDLEDAYNYSQNNLMNMNSSNLDIYVIIGIIVAVILILLFLKFYVHIKLHQINKHNENIELELKKLNQNLYNIYCQNKEKSDKNA